VEALGLDLVTDQFPTDAVHALTRASKYPSSVGLPLRCPVSFVPCQVRGC
jgi:hypothetical protein